MKIKPLGERVVLRPVSEEATSKSGIILPDSAKREKQGQGVIVDVGNVDYLKVGQLVLFPIFEAQEVKVGGIDYKIIDADQILAVLEKGKEKNNA